MRSKRIRDGSSLRSIDFRPKWTGSPENSRLTEALNHAESGHIFAMILIGAGGFLVSYAAFTGRAAETWANVAVGGLLAGIVMMLWQSVHRWRTH
jgi:hypothetical protein